MIDPSSVLLCIITLNVRGIKCNIDYLRYLISHSDFPLIICICEHWLHSYEISFLSNALPGLKSTIEVIQEDHCFAPKLVRGRSGVAVIWDPCLDQIISPVQALRNDRIVGIRIAYSPTDLVLFSVYLPCRSGCTDNFKAVMDELDSAFDLFPNEIILFAGDFNADPGISQGNLNCPPNEQGIILNRYLYKWDYVSIHLHPSFFSCNNFYTYESDAHGSQSVIDHVLCPRFFTSTIRDTFVISEHPLNTSDHLPLSVLLPLKHSPPVSFPQVGHLKAPYSPNWKKCNSHDINLYAKAVLSSLPPLPTAWSISTIDSTVFQVTEALLSSASQVIPPIQYRKHARPNWNSTLGKAHQLGKDAYRKWCSAGKPSDSSNPIRIQYKEAKRKFRRELRKYKRQELDTFFNSLDLDDRKLYQHVRLRKGIVSPPTTKLTVNNATFEGASLPEGWALYFEGLAKPNPGNYCPNNSIEVESHLLDILSTSSPSLQGAPVTSELVQKAIKSLALRKASGPDQLFAEHFTHGPTAGLSKILAPLFQAMLRLHYVPPSFTSSFVIPTVKGRGLDASNPSNYRGISIASVFSKLFELIILELFLLPLSSNLHNLQGGFRQGLSTSHTSFILLESIAWCKEHHWKAFIAFLDARKAFDTVWHTGLFVKLREFGLTGDAWDTLHFWYRHLSSRVKWQGSISRAFPILQGVRQGALLSPLMYAIYINDLLIELEACQFGVRIGSLFCGSPTYADDMSLVAPSDVELQQMLDIAGMYAYKWQYTFNANKSKVMVFGESAASRRELRKSRLWYISGSIIAESDSISHLGITLSLSGSSLNHTMKSISLARSSFYSLHSVGPRFGCLHSTTALKLFKAFPLSILRFGLEVIFPSKFQHRDQYA